MSVGLNKVLNIFFCCPLELWDCNGCSLVCKHTRTRCVYESRSLIIFQLTLQQRAPFLASSLEKHLSSNFNFMWNFLHFRPKETRGSFPHFAARPDVIANASCSIWGTYVNVSNVSFVAFHPTVTKRGINEKSNLPSNDLPSWAESHLTSLVACD